MIVLRRASSQNHACCSVLNMDDLLVSGSPLEKMVLMLNDKIDVLQDHIININSFVRSEQHAIPWNSLYFASSFGMYNADPTMANLPEPPQYLNEWDRRGWNIWKVTAPSHPEVAPYYTIAKKGARLPETAIYPSKDPDGPFSGIRTSTVHERVFP